MILDGAEKGALRITEAKTTQGVVAGVSAVGHWTCELPCYHLERGLDTVPFSLVYCLPRALGLRSFSCAEFFCAIPSRKRPTMECRPTPIKRFPFCTVPFKWNTFTVKFPFCTRKRSINTLSVSYRRIKNQG